LSNLYNKKKRAWQKFKRSLKGTDYDKYKEIAELYKSSCIKVKRDFESRLFSKVSKNPQSFFNYISKIQYAPSNQINIFNDNKSAFLSDCEAANKFAKYFSSVFINDNGVLPNFVNVNPSSPNIALKVTSTDVICAIRKLNKQACPGPDGLPASFISCIGCFIEEPLSHIFNSFIVSAFCSDNWKFSVIIPIYKSKDNCAELCNYRLISLITCFSNIFEKIVCVHMRQYLVSNKILNQHQFGFMKEKGVVDQMLECMHFWQLALENKAELHCVYFDIAKAFDTVSHRKLIFKLRCMGINSTLTDWLTSYLSDRCFVVKVNGVHSSKFKVLSGVPQGSTLGPLLFICYINDLFSVVSFSSMFMFADDCKLMKLMSTMDDQNLLQLDINCVYQWYITWQFKPNIDKTMFLNLFGKMLASYVVNNTNILLNKSVTDLGISYDSNLSFRGHIMMISRRAYYVLHNMFCMFQHHNANFYVHLFVTYIRPLLENCTVIWSPHLIKDIDYIENIQRYFTRRICPPNLNYIQRLQVLNLKSLEVRRIMFDLKYFFKLRLSNSTLFAAHFVSFSSSRYINHYRVSYTHSVTAKNLWFHRVVKFWNYLPDNVKCIQSYAQFCNHLNNCNFDVLLKGAAHN
jgi:hypothetical protein